MCSVFRRYPAAMNPVSADPFENLVLLPTPRVAERLPGTVECPARLRDDVHALTKNVRHYPHSLEVAEDRALSSRYAAYCLEVRASPKGHARITITAGDESGIRAAAATLWQILKACTNTLPCLRIEDHAVFRTRGVMLDVSRDRVPTMAHLRSVVDLMASLKFNHLQLYTEHAFAYRGHEGVWRDASPITPDEARALSGYCADRGIELSANQNCFGHLAKWLRMPEYRHLAEIERDDQEWRFMHFPRFGPFSLCPTEPRAVEFVRDLLSQLAPCFKSGRVNIGCDETFDVGWGRSRQVVEEIVSGGATPERARAEVFFNFVREICGALASVGGSMRTHLTPMMWGDIALHHADLLHMLPDGVIGLAWEYEPTEKFGPWCDVLREHGHEAWVCPGTSTWRSFTGRTRERRANIADAAEQGAASGATGFLVCDWGDVGHRQHWPISLMPLAQAAEAAWNPASARSFNPRVASQVLFHDGGALGQWLEELGDVDAEVRAAAKLRNATALFSDLHCPLSTPPGGRPIKPDVGLGLWIDARAKLSRLQSSCPHVHDALVRQELGATCSRVDLALRHAIAAREGTLPPPRGTRENLAELARDVIEEHERLWPARSRPGGFADSVAHDHAILRGILDAPSPGPTPTPART